MLVKSRFEMNLMFFKVCSSSTQPFMLRGRLRIVLVGSRSSNMCFIVMRVWHVFHIGGCSLLIGKECVAKVCVQWRYLRWQYLDVG